MKINISNQTQRTREKEKAEYRRTIREALAGPKGKLLKSLATKVKRDKRSHEEYIASCEAYIASRRARVKRRKVT